MISVIILGTYNNTDISDFLFKNLSSQFNVSYFCNGRFEELGTGEKIVLYKTDKITHCDLTKCIVIIENDASVELSGIFKNDTVFIISSEEQEYLKFLSKFNQKIITFGLSQKDTVTFSSRNDDEIVISLQRTVNNINGEAIEPFEIPLKKSHSNDDFALLAYISLLIEIGNIDKYLH